ncbi:MAG: hypothetical protein AB7G93_01800 [Bdellovibrionales bacterium]
MKVSKTKVLFPSIVAALPAFATVAGIVTDRSLPSDLHDIKAVREQNPNYPWSTILEVANATGDDMWERKANPSIKRKAIQLGTEFRHVSLSIKEGTGASAPYLAAINAHEQCSKAGYVGNALHRCILEVTCRGLRSYSQLCEHPEALSALANQGTGTATVEPEAATTAPGTATTEPGVPAAR